ncbi:hypothetical protein BZA77DRAFT_290571 [Pyronema omphalodes]|nr:hypothetical protein BZA77DRAFT_290571 [Pyronema omphalodes]
MSAEYNHAFWSSSPRPGLQASVPTESPGIQGENGFNLEAFESRATECGFAYIRPFLKLQFPTLPRRYNHSVREPALFRLRALLSRFDIQRMDVVPIELGKAGKFQLARCLTYNAHAALVQRVQRHFHDRIQQFRRDGEELEAELLAQLLINMQLKIDKSRDATQIIDIEAALARNRQNIMAIYEEVHSLIMSDTAREVLFSMEQEDEGLADLYIACDTFLRLANFTSSEDQRFLVGLKVAIAERCKELERALWIHRSVLGIPTYDFYERRTTVYMVE